MSTTSPYTATRTGNRITVRDVSGEAIKVIGGARVARAAAVVVVRFPNPHHDRVNIYCRADAHAAATEAHRYVTATTMRNRGVAVDVPPAEFAYAVTVEDA